jgi:hypothetical protein
MKKQILILAIIFFTFKISAQQNTPKVTQATAGTLTVTFSTVNTNKYSLTAYITNSTGALVNTMLYNTTNGDGSARKMTTYWPLIGSSWSVSPTKLLTNTDAVTGASKNAPYTAKTIYWGKTASIADLPDGTYTINFEMVNYPPDSRRYVSGTFVKGPIISNSSIPNSTGFANISAQWLPAATAIEDYKLNTIKIQYLNKNISISGLEVGDKLDLYSLDGKNIDSRIARNGRELINVKNRGVYVVKINDKVFKILK